MPVNFQRALADATQFSPIRYAATPTLKLSELTASGNFPYQNCTFTHSGGTALSIAGRELQLQKNVILVPSYHCPAAIEPFIWLGFECIFYRVNKDLSPNSEHMTRLLAQHKITHCLTINYFGVICHLPMLAEMLKGRDIAIIHDCAHALFDLLSYSKTPTLADATICSINKILPSIDGGIVTFKGIASKKLTSVGFIEEFKALLYLLGVTAIINRVRFAFTKPPAMTIIPATGNSAPPLRYFAHRKINRQCFRHTISLLRHSSLEDIAKRRRANYNYLCSQLSDISLGTVLKPHLDKRNIPYVLPFLLHDKKDFSKVRETGIQCLRWEEVAQTDCKVSQDYRARLLQLPCHHQLSQKELDSMVNKLKGLL